MGVGAQGSSLLEAAGKLPGVVCAAAADLYDGRLLRAREIAGKELRTTRRYEELLTDKDIDCIVAAVPDHWHKKILLDAVQAGKDVYCEKPMSHTAADGFEMVAAARASSQIVQIGSQRTSSVVCGRARELMEAGLLGDIQAIEGSLGRNGPSGAWQYAPPSDLSPKTLDWDTWQGGAKKRPFDPVVFARWRCFRQYGTGVAGDLMVHLLSGLLFVWGRSAAPTRAMAMGSILRWKDGRDMPDTHAAIFDFGGVPVCLRVNLGSETEEVLRFLGSKGVMEVREKEVRFSPQSGRDLAPSWYASGLPRAMRDEYLRRWHSDNDLLPGKEPLVQSTVYSGPSYNLLGPHLSRFFDAVRSRRRVVQDALFGHHAALACHMANESYWRGTSVALDPAGRRILRA